MCQITADSPATSLFLNDKRRYLYHDVTMSIFRPSIFPRRSLPFTGFFILVYLCFPLSITASIVWKVLDDLLVTLLYAFESGAVKGMLDNDEVSMKLLDGDDAVAGDSE